MSDEVTNISKTAALVLAQQKANQEVIQRILDIGYAPNIQPLGQLRLELLIDQVLQRDSEERAQYDLKFETEAYDFLQGCLEDAIEQRDAAASQAAKPQLLLPQMNGGIQLDIPGIGGN